MPCCPQLTGPEPQVPAMATSGQVRARRLGVPPGPRARLVAIDAALPYRGGSADWVGDPLICDPLPTVPYVLPM
jgi:hypothetical protein